MWIVDQSVKLRLYQRETRSVKVEEDFMFFCTVQCNIIININQQNTHFLNEYFNF